MLRDCATGGPSAEDAFVEHLWSELHGIAAAQLRRESAGHTLQPTALIHEAWLKLIDSTALVEGDRERFLALSSRAIRQVLVDHARRRKAARRGGGEWRRVPLHGDLVDDGRRDIELIDLDRLLEALSQLDERMGRVVELRFFGGLTEVETAAVLGVTDRTVRSDWRTARAWLRREMDRSEGA